jgi:hypothetical protein
MACVALAAIELGDEREETIRGRVQMPPELRDVGLECFEGTMLGRADRGVERGDFER